MKHFNHQETRETGRVLPFPHPDPHRRMGQSIARASDAWGSFADDWHRTRLMDDALQFARRRDAYQREAAAARRGRALSRLLLACAAAIFLSIGAGAFITKAFANAHATVQQAGAME